MSNIIIPQVDIIIKKEEMVQLNNIIGIIPTAYGFNIANFFHLINQKRIAEQKLSETPTSSN